MSSPYSASGNNGISVADAKAYIASIDSDAIQDQITHYANAAASLNTLASSVTRINNNLQATWSGAAANAANTQFGIMASRASNLAAMLSNQVVPALTTVYEGAQSAQKQIERVQDEITSVPRFMNTDTIVNTGSATTTTIFPVVSSLAAMPPENPNANMTQFQAERFNTRQRAFAANAMNAAASPYSATTAKFTSIVNSARDAADVPAANSATGYTFTPSNVRSESSGAAHGYHASFSDGRVSAENFSGSTSLQDYVPPIRPVARPSLFPTTIMPPSSLPAVPPPPGSRTDVIGDSAPAPAGVFGESGLPRADDGSMSDGSGFGEGGVLRGTSSGIVPDSTGFGAPTTPGARSGMVGGDPGQSAERLPSAMMGGGSMQGGWAEGSRSDGILSRSAAYLRGRYLGDEAGAISATAKWETPAIGGSEGVLISAQPSEATGVRSVYADAQDGQGNPLGMLDGGFKVGHSASDDSDEAGPRPGYVKGIRNDGRPRAPMFPR